LGLDSHVTTFGLRRSRKREERAKFRRLDEVLVK
jgi:hypothetical protein